MTRNFLPNFSYRESVFSRGEVNSSSDKSILIRMDILTMIKVLTCQISKTMTKPWSIEKPNKSIYPSDSKQSDDSGWLSHFKSFIIYDSLELGAYHPQNCQYLCALWIFAQFILFALNPPHSHRSVVWTLYSFFFRSSPVYFKRSWLECGSFFILIDWPEPK